MLRTLKEKIGFLRRYFSKTVEIRATAQETFRGCPSGSPADPKQEFWARLFPNSIKAEEFDDIYGTNYSGRRNASGDMSAKDVSQARRGRGEYAGKTGNVFVDSPFFNPWAPGGAFNKR